jgi:hypothetical protein
MEIAWLSFELCAGMEMAAASIDGACAITMARRRIADPNRIGAEPFGGASGRSHGLFGEEDEKSVRSE